MGHNTNDDDDRTRNTPDDDQSHNPPADPQPPARDEVARGSRPPGRPPRGKSAPPGKRIDIKRMARRLRIAPREARVLACLDAGLHTPQIAAALNITANTVKHYLKLINLKMGTNSRLDAMQRWYGAIRDMEREGRPPWIDDPTPPADPAPPTPPPPSPPDKSA